MKNIIFLFSASLILLPGCAIRQDITFHEEGHISFNMLVSKAISDAHYGNSHVWDLLQFIDQKTGMIEKNGTIDADRLINTSQVELTDEQRDGLQLLAKMKVKKTSRTGPNRAIFFTITGTFENLDELNKAFAAVPLLTQTVDGFEKFEEFGLNAYFEQHFVYTQEGDRVSIHSEPMPNKKEVTVENVERNFYTVGHFGTDPYETRYTFPFDVKTKRKIR